MPSMSTDRGLTDLKKESLCTYSEAGMFKVGGGFKNQKYAYDANGNVEYLGEHALNGASIDDPSWNIWKIAYDLNGRVSSRQGPLEGKWSEREQFGW